MVQFVVGEEVNEGFSTMKTEEMVQKASQKVAVVTYHAAGIRDRVTLVFAQLFCTFILFGMMSVEASSGRLAGHLCPIV